MKIAISGTHCTGKSTLIDGFLLAHPEFVHEPEAYEAVEDYGESFAADPSVEDFQRQLEYNVQRIGQYGTDDLVIFERCTVDYLAYMFALIDLGRHRNTSRFLEDVLVMVREAVAQLDLIVFLPASSMVVELSEEEDLELRSAVDSRLESILLADELALFTSDHPVVLEVSGTTKHRLEMLESAM